MPIKVILAPIQGDDSDRSILDQAFRLAENHAAHIQALHVVMDGRDAVPFVGQGLSAHVVEQIIRSVEDEAKEARANAQETFKQWTKDKGVQVVKPDATPLTDKTLGQSVSISWHEISGQAQSIIPMVGRLSDMILLPQPTHDSEKDDHLMAETALLEAGGPIMFVPSTKKDTFAKNIALFWNGSIESSRALDAIRPFIPHAEHVYLITAPEVDNLGEDADTVINYLAWHKIKASVVKVKCDRDEVGDTLIKKAEELNVDMIAMGAYSHSRLRQMILGSVTRTVLYNTKIPTLFVH